MGLDITAYRRVQKIADWPEAAESADDWLEYGQGSYWHDDQAVTRVYPYGPANFPEHAAPLTAGAYTYTEEFDFCAGSYGGYNNWRAWLSRNTLGVAPEAVWRNFDDFRVRGIAWLVNFSDCEGVIGAPVAALILADLRANEAALRNDTSEGGWYVRKLDDWLRALEMAADGGFVEFH